MKTSSAKQSLAAYVVDALRAWWDQDRIRVSPREGQLLTLQAPCILEIHGQLVQLTDRVVGQSENGAYVEYRGTVVESESACALRATPYNGDVCWTVDGKNVWLVPSDIIVYDGHRQLRRSEWQLVE